MLQRRHLRLERLVYSVTSVSTRVSRANRREPWKVFVLNLSAPFIPQFFKAQLDQLLPYCDVVIGNESEAEAWAEASGQPEKKDLQAVARAIALTTKANPSRPRTVIITHGAESTTVVTAGENSTPKVYPVQALPDSAIVDTNGAGDAFAGGVLAALVLGKSIDDAVEVGHKMGSMCVQLVRNKHLVAHLRTTDLTVVLGRSSVQMAQGSGYLSDKSKRTWIKVLSTANALNSA